MSNCVGCGSAVDPTTEEANQAVNDVLVASLKDAQKHGEICPLCGHSQAQPVSQRKTVLFGMLALLLIIAIAIAITNFQYRNTERRAVAQEALKQLEPDALITQYLGRPISVQGDIVGAVRHDETGWQEAKLTIPVRGPDGNGTIQVSGGRETGPWQFTTLQLFVPQLQKKADLITGKVADFAPGDYVDMHTEAAATPEYVNADVPPPSWDGNYPCVYASASVTAAPQFGNCVTRVPMSKESKNPVDRFETDLRTGKFILRQTDLSVSEAGLEIPLTRTYASNAWIPRNKSQAFGINATHPYDIAPLGTRNPYTEQYIVLEDDNFLYFPRVSKGTGYSDAVYRQSEAGNSFYKALQQWDGNGWLTTLQDGSTIRFPESYSAKNMAQGAPIEMTDSKGNKIELVRDGKRNLQEIRGPGGESIKLSYDDSDRIMRAETSAGLWTHYTYDNSGFLSDVAHSDGTARHYSYDGGLLQYVRDEKDRVLVHNFYDYQSGGLTRQEYGSGAAVSYQYIPSFNRKYAQQATVTLPDGSVKTVETRNSVSELYKNMQ